MPNAFSDNIFYPEFILSSYKNTLCYKRALEGGGGIEKTRKIYSAFISSVCYDLLCYKDAQPSSSRMYSGVVFLKYYTLFIYKCELSLIQQTRTKKICCFARIFFKKCKEDCVSNFCEISVLCVNQ